MLTGNINPKRMKQMMKQLGMDIQPIENVEKIVISTSEGQYIFNSAEVSVMKMQGTVTYQITGDPVFEEKRAEIPESDISLVTEQTGASPEEVRKVLSETNGDIAEAILRLSKE